MFNIFINDLSKEIETENSPWIGKESKIPCLLYADDLVMLSQSKIDLQEKMNKLEKYCTKWGLHINKSKTKIMIFTKSSPKIPILFV